MPKYIIPLSFLLTVWSTAYTDTNTGIVLRVADGDTFTLLTDTKKRLIIRLAYIDAPELDQSFGLTSKDKLKRFLNGKIVTVKSHTIDKWGRIIGTAYINGLDINLEMIKFGLAWHYKHYAKSQSPIPKMEYANSEDRAKKLRHGLWSDYLSIPPWDWRHAKK